MGEWDLKISRTEHMSDDIKQGFFSSNHIAIIRKLATWTSALSLSDQIPRACGE